MKLSGLVTKFIYLLFALFLAHCSADGIKIDLHADGSGKAVFNDLVYDIQENNSEKHGFSGVTNTSGLTMVYKQSEFLFQDANKMDLGGIRVKLKLKKDTGKLTLTIPLDTDAAWSRYLNLQYRQTNDHKREQIIDKIKENTQGNGGLFGPSLFSGFRQGITEIQFQLNVPGDITSARLLKPSDKTNWLKIENKAQPENPLGISALEDSAAEKNNSRITINIPLKEFLAQKYKKVKLKLEYKKTQAEKIHKTSGVITQRQEI